MIRTATGFAALLLASVALAADPPANAAPAGKADDNPPQDAVTAANTAARLDLAYGADPKQKLDIYRPKGVTNAPVVAFVHGGEWMKGDKAMVSFKPKFLNENGVVFASINYRLSPAAKHPAHVSDVAAAVRWLHDHAAEYGGDPGRVVLVGHSAGCHLAVLTALDPRYLAAVKLTPADLRGVVAWSGGSFDLVHKAKTDAKFVGYIRDAFGDKEDDWKDASPAAHAAGAKGAPPFLFVTADPRGDSFKVADRLAGLIRDAGGKATTAVIEGRTHRTANHLLGSPGDTTGQVLLDFVRTAAK